MGVFQAKKAVRTKRPLKVSLEGISGGGKTYTALRLAFDMVRNGIGRRIVVIDSENESAGLYAGQSEDGERWEYDTVDMPAGKRNPAGYAEAYEWAVAQGYDIVIVDSLSHAWHGAMEIVDQVAAGSRGDKFKGWNVVTPQQRQMIQTLTDTRAHCIVTMRVKTEYGDVEGRDGKVRKAKIGLKSDQRENTEYEFDLVLRFEAGNECRVDKVRGCTEMNGRSAHVPGPAFWKPLFEWWKGGADVPQPEPVTVDRLFELVDELAKIRGVNTVDLVGKVVRALDPNAQALEDLAPAKIRDGILSTKNKIAQERPAASPPPPASPPTVPAEAVKPPAEGASPEQAACALELEKAYARIMDQAELDEHSVKCGLAAKAGKITTAQADRLREIHAETARWIQQRAGRQEAAR